MLSAMPLRANGANLSGANLQKKKKHYQQTMLLAADSAFKKLVICLSSYCLLSDQHTEDTDLDCLSMVSVSNIEEVVTTIYLHVWRGEGALWIIFKA